jgi:transposase
MILKEHELLQIDEEFICRLREQDPDALAGLSIKLVSDLKEAVERLNQNPSNSSRPSGSLAPWDKGIAGDDNDDESTSDEKEVLRLETSIDKEESSDTAGTIEKDRLQSKETTEQRKPGRQGGSQGFGRTQKLAVTNTTHHACGCCSACHEDLTAVEKAYTGFHTVNIEFGKSDSPGVQLTNTRHLYYKGLCPKCGLENRSEPWRAPADTADWNNVGMTQWRLIGPDLAALIVYLAMDMRVTRRKIKQFLVDVFGLELSIGTHYKTA